jgi:hypothetical protein
VVDSGFMLVKPVLLPDVFEEVTHALFYEQLLKVEYRPGYWGESDKNPAPKTLMPLAMVESEGHAMLK